jgi:hypothetical protein
MKPSSEWQHSFLAIKKIRAVERMMQDLLHGSSGEGILERRGRIV